VGAATLDFLDAYFAEGNSCPTLPESRREAERLIDLFALEKAFYEVSYEVANRPHWLHIPLEGILSRLEERERR
jgi:maltose alpha-D-glucosyltransferase/alpha-amylase